MMPRDIYIFMGPPGSGKGTLSARCVDELNWQSLSTGDLCRQQIAAKTDLGHDIDFILKSGKLVPDSIITDMVLDWFRRDLSYVSTVILDGFPRTVQQATIFCEKLQKMNLFGCMRVFELVVDDSTILKRLMTRCVCSNKNCQMVYSLPANAVRTSLCSMACEKCCAPLERRKDDGEQQVIERLKIYREHRAELFNFFQQAADIPIHVLNAQVSPDNLFIEFKEIIESPAL